MAGAIWCIIGCRFYEQIGAGNNTFPTNLADGLHKNKPWDQSWRTTFRGRLWETIRTKKKKTCSSLRLLFLRSDRALEGCDVLKTAGIFGIKNNNFLCFIVNDNIPVWTQQWGFFGEDLRPAFSRRNRVDRWNKKLLTPLTRLSRLPSASHKSWKNF